MADNNEVLFIGTGAIFIGENSKKFLIDTQILSHSENERVLFFNKVRRFGCKTVLTDKERELVVSKVVELTTEIKWQVQ